MYEGKTTTVENRIVNIDQPNVLPMVRGKDVKNVEFRAKVNISLGQGYTGVAQVSFGALNEGRHLKEQVESFKNCMDNTQSW